MKEIRPWRAVLFFGVVGFMLIAAYLLRETGGVGWMPGCWFRKVTDLECPGCGMTRGTHALLNGRWIEAFGFNPVGMILLPVALVGVGIESWAWVRGKSVMRGLYFGKWAGFVLLVVLILWWIGRNVF